MAKLTKKTDKEIANDKVERLMRGIGIWGGFYRENPHRFCEEYLNIHLKIFQKILLYMMNKSNYFMYLASTTEPYSRNVILQTQ